MELKDRFYLNVAKLIPLRYKTYLKELSKYAGEEIDVDLYLGSSTVLGILISIAVLLMSYAFAQELIIHYVFFAALALMLIELIAYLIIYFKVEDRTKKVEEVLPDALQLIAANVRAGMTPYKALKLAARKEFGPLEEEIKRTTSRALGTESFSEILLKMSERVKSDILERVTALFTAAMRSGGHLATLLEELAKDINETRSLKRELVTSTKTYVSFIMFTIVLGAPLLLVISIQFIDVTTMMQERAGVTDVGFGLGFLAGEITVTADFLTKMAIAMLIATSLLASILLGVIQEGKPRYGFRYAPIIMSGTLIAFFIFRHVVKNFFGKIM